MVNPSIQGFVNFLADQGLVVRIICEGELHGVFRLDYGRCPVDHPWVASLGLLWEEATQELVARWNLIPQGWGHGWSISTIFHRDDVPTEVSISEYAMAKVRAHIHRTRGNGTGAKCLFRVTSSRWFQEETEIGKPDGEACG